MAQTVSKCRAGRVGLVCLLSGLVTGGCKSASAYHREADRVAQRIIDQKQKETLGKVEPFTIERPADTLRRRLMIAQGLPYSAPASLSARDVKPVKNFPEKPAAATSQPSTVMPLGMVGGTDTSTTTAEPALAPLSAGSLAPTTAPATQPALTIALIEAIQIGARNSSAYQSQKERIFIDALRLDLERNDFRPIFDGTVSGTVVNDHTGGGAPDTGAVGSTSLSLQQRLTNGAVLTGRLSMDLAKLLTGDRSSAYGIAGDASIAIPLMRGAGQAVVTEPLTQAERDVAYDLLEFEQYKRGFAVDLAQQYLSVLQQQDQIANATAAYRRAIASTRRARRLADAGRLPEIQVDQSVQQELRSRDRWISAKIGLDRRLDNFKLAMGLPPDARIQLDATELDRLVATAQSRMGATTSPSSADTVAPPTQPTTAGTDTGAYENPDDIPLVEPSLVGAGPLEMSADRAIALALANRPDLLVANGEVFDAQRKVIVAADALRAGLTLTGTASAGGRRSSAFSGGSGNADFRPEQGVYSGGLLLDLPLERTAERNAYRTSMINLDAAARNVQQVEDRIKLDVRADLRNLLLAREEVKIQAKSVAVAQKRVASTNLFLEAGRAEIRDVLDAQDALVQAQDAYTSAVVSYRVAEWTIQEDLGLLEVSNQGLWREYPGAEPTAPDATDPAALLVATAGMLGAPPTTQPAQ